MFPAVLEGEGLRLRLLTVADAPAMHASASLPEVFEFTGEIWTLEAMEQFTRDSVSGSAKGTWCRYGIILPDSDVPIGGIGLHNIDLRNRRCEVGYDLSPAHWGTGVMTRAPLPVLAWAFGEGGFNRIEATVMQGNERSGRLLERLGFKAEAMLREYELVRGEFRNYSMWSLLRSEWARRVAATL